MFGYIFVVRGSNNTTYWMKLKVNMTNLVNCETKTKILAT